MNPCVNTRAPKRDSLALPIFFFLTNMKMGVTDHKYWGGVTVLFFLNPLIFSYLDN